MSGPQDCSRRVLVPEKLAELLAEKGISPSALVTWEGDLPPASAIAAASAAVLWHRDPAKLASHLLAHKDRWRWMHSLWTGLEHLPLPALRRSVRALTTGRGTGAIPLAEWVLTALLWHAKRLAEHERAFRGGRWEQLELAELWGSHVVVVGLGAIGRSVAVLLQKLGVRVTGVRRQAQPTRGCQQVVDLEALSQAVLQARALVVALPATPTTAGLVNQRVLDALPEGSLVVNVGRAAVIEEEALYSQVAAGRLWAALDVWWQEPLPPESPWRKLSQLLPSPHGAYYSERFRQRHLQRVAENVRAFLEGKKLRCAVNRRQWAELLGEGTGP